MIRSVPEVLAGHRLAVVDLEGNGQQPPEIIEIAVLLVDGDVTEHDVVSWLVHPRTPITSFVTRRVHGISNEDVAGCPPWTAVGAKVEPLLGDRVLVAHNAAVEHRTLTAHLPNWQPPLVLDTLRLARHILPDLSGHRLTQLVTALELDAGALTEQRHHRAAYDTWCAWQLLCALAERSELDWPGLINAAAMPGIPPDDMEASLW